MIWRLLTSVDVQPKFYLNGFPKSGLHLAAMMVIARFQQQPSSYLHQTNWIGTFGDNSWSGQFCDLKRVTHRLCELQPGCYLKGHAGYKSELNDFMYYAGIAHVFVYRDLRDVAVSQAHHLTSNDDNRFKHPAKQFYRSLGSFDDVLTAVIEGAGPYPGVLDRWELFAPWLKEDWVLKVTFEDLIKDRKEAAANILEYGLGRVLEFCQWTNTVEGKLFDETVNDMAAMSEKTELSPTFRQGKVGEWQEKFTDKHKDLFKELDEWNWLEQLGYAEGDDW